MEQEQQDPPIAPPRTKTEGKSPEEVKHAKFIRLHAEAYTATTQAMHLDEERQKEQAFNAYQKSLELIDKAVDLAHSGGFPPEKVNRVDELVYKMRFTRFGYY